MRESDRETHRIRLWQRPRAVAVGAAIVIVVALIVLLGIRLRSGWFAAKTDTLYKVFDGRFAGYINANGKCVIPLQYEWASQFDNDCAIVRRDSQTSVITKSGDSIISTSGLLWPIDRRTFVVVDDGGLRVVDDNGDSIPRFAKGLMNVNGSFSEGLLSVQNADGWGYLDQGGQFAIAPQFLHAAPFSEGLAAVSVNGRFGYIDRNGTQVIEARFDWAGNFSEGLAVVSLDGNDMYIDRSGAVALGPYGKAWTFKEGLGLVRITRNQQSPVLPPLEYVDRRGRRAISQLFVEARPFCESLAAVRTSEGRSGYIDHSGRIVIAVDDAERLFDFDNGVAIVLTTQRAGCIDRTGNWLWQTPIQPAIQK